MNRAWVVLTLLLVGCGPEAHLSGSLGVVFPLDISAMRIAQNEEALQITYLRNRSTFLDVVVRVSVSLRDIELKPGARIDLAGDYEDGHPRTVVAHAPGGEPVRLLPRVRRGDMTISSVTTFDPDGGVPSGATRGSFGILFEEKGGDIGFGRTLNGNFAAVATDAGFGLP